MLNETYLSSVSFQILNCHSDHCLRFPKGDQNAEIVTINTNKKTDSCGLHQYKQNMLVTIWNMNNYCFRFRLYSNERKKKINLQSCFC